MKRFIKMFLCLMAVFLMWGISAFASENVKIMEIQDQGDNPVLFVSGIEEEVLSTEALIGNTAAEDVLVRPIAEEEVSIKTLILLDNSLSIPEATRTDVKDIIFELIASRSSNEQFSVSTFGEHIEELTGFTSDYTQLKQAVENIEFQDRETYLTDVLYDLLQNDHFGAGEAPVYSRIFVISDGVDNKTLGYTTEELYSLLEKNGVPIYALGVYNRNQTNEEELKNMFALSRQTNAESFLLDELEDPMEVITTLAKDQDIIRFDIVPGTQSKDGSEKTISLQIQTSGGTVSVQADNVRMIQTADMPEEESVEEIETEIVTEPAPEPVVEETYDNRILLLIGIVLAGVIAVIIIVIILVCRAVKKKKENAIIKETELPFETDISENNNTEFVWDRPEIKDNGQTLQMFDNYNRYTIVLTDVNSPARSFRKDIDGKLVIGRAAAKVDICIDYDQSVSSRHCMIEKRGEKFYLVDLQSKNYTYWNDNKVLSEVEIHSGGIIKMGRVKLWVEVS